MGPMTAAARFLEDLRGGAERIPGAGDLARLGASLHGSLALRGDGLHFMPLDNCIEAMRQTGIDMNVQYKETSTGGLAVNLPEC
jgi:L-serine dehydratase